MGDRTLPTAALVPFTLSPEGIFGQETLSLEALGACRQDMEKAGIQEMMIGYRDLADLDAIARII
jgi:hypothetical protein